MRISVRGLLALVALALGSGLASARDVTIVVSDGGGHPVPDAVVTLDAPGQPPAPGHFKIDQKQMTFIPFVSVVPVGSTVDFTNRDAFRHHVYSFSPAKKFELKLFAQGESRAVVFDRPGVVAIGCNIHDSMQAFVVVVDTRFASRTGNDGRAVLRGVAGGKLAVKVWHPNLRAPGNQTTVSIPGGGDVAVPVLVKLRRAAPMQHSY